MWVPIWIAGIMLSAPMDGQHLAGGKDLSGGGSLRIMWYNAENLFHPGNDSIDGDDEFTPAGIRHWTMERYRKKVTSVAKVIVAAGKGDPPELVGLCEVENRQVLEDLVSHPVLAPYHYQVIHADSPDIRGTDVAAIFRSNRISQTGWSVIHSDASGRGVATRQMLLMEITWGRDTMELILVHLISKFSGEGATAASRREQAMQLTQLIDSLHLGHPDRLKVVGGDFNEPEDGYSIEPLHQARFGSDSLVHIPLSEGPGSYKYRGRWSCIDHFFLCGPLETYRITGMVFVLPALLVPDETYGGWKPFRTYQGPAYTGGISDHLPIILMLSRSLFSVDSGW
jgi:endonuclease/exonuclease/phosphatase family metal-dependent hydrolase